MSTLMKKKSRGPSRGRGHRRLTDDAGPATAYARGASGVLVPILTVLIRSLSAASSSC